MDGFQDTEQVAASDYYRLYRHDLVFGVEVWGVLDDARSDGWRGAVTAELDRAGRPRYFVLDASRAEPVSSLAARVRSAAFTRTEAKRFEQAYLYTGRQAKTSFIIRTVLRMAGMANVAVVGDPDRFAQVIVELRAGRGAEGALQGGTAA